MQVVFLYTEQRHLSLHCWHLLWKEFCSICFWF